MGTITSRPKPNALAGPMPRVKDSWNLVGSFTVSTP